MNLKAKKISLIQELLRIDDVNIIDTIEKFLHKTKNNHFEDNLKPMSLQQFNDEIDQALDDEKNGRLIKSEELKRKLML